MSNTALNQKRTKTIVESKYFATKQAFESCCDVVQKNVENGAISVGSVDLAAFLKKIKALHSTLEFSNSKSPKAILVDRMTFYTALDVPHNPDAQAIVFLYENEDKTYYIALE
ncbi:MULTISPECIES: hypothetical protein [unclassified Myroides]|uniref:hypothetical protein n=1 Tax=unclassified Myroides TaxID=2642485 RepID=UPI003100CD85